MHKSKPYALVVDDEWAVAATLALILNKYGYLVTAVQSGEAALEVCQAFTPDLVVLDVVLPGITGFEVAVCLKEIRPECNVVLMSGNKHTEDLLKGSKQEFDVLAKPFHPHELLRRIHSAK